MPPKDLDLTQTKQGENKMEITRTRENISNYSDNELLLIVDNTEFLYNIKSNPNFIEILKHLYIFNNKQEKVLRDNIFETLDIG
tara:strand:- start:4 stop:255 length:252 start_codon:yes stop_codon:yes gene_type:complete